jgi:predicted permease
VLLIYGEAGLLPGIITTVITGVVVIAMATVILEIDANTRLGFFAVAGRVLVGVLRSPLLLSALGGLAVSGLGLELPRPVQTFCDFLGAAAAPCALFAIGLFMVDTSLRTGLTEVGWIALLKLILQPALTWWLAFEVLALPPVWAGVAVIQAALPTGALVFVIAQQYGIYVQRATAVILVSTLVSVVTLSLLLIQLGVG